jgi:uncharacterized protein with FMN-binding domain
LEAALKGLILSFLVFAPALLTSAAEAATTQSQPGGVAALVPVASTTPAVDYADGTYTGPSVDAYYGRVQMQVTIKAGRIAGFKLLDYPHHTDTSVMINKQALPMLANEVIASQDANVDIVTGATLTSQAFIKSLGDAFQQARH